jgi:mutator protein MutT
VDRAELVCGLLVRDGTALLVHRSPTRAIYPGVWDFPGGHVEPGESGPAALVRELAEELGVTIAEPTGVEDLLLAEDAWRLRVWVIREWTGEPRNVQPDEHDDLAWFDRTGALALEFADPEYRELLADALV